MEEFCRKESLTRQFFREEYIQNELICNKENKKNEIYFFKPREESAVILSQWLQYRGYPANILQNKTQEDLANLSIQNFQDNGNSPAFALFMFEPSQVSDTFVIMWLSWYGISSSIHRDRTWWNTTCKQVQSEVKRLNVYHHSYNLQTFTKLRSLYRRLDEILFKVGSYVDDLPSIIKKTEAVANPQETEKRALSSLADGDFIQSPIYTNRQGKILTNGIPIKILKNIKDSTIQLGIQLATNYVKEKMLNHNILQEISKKTSETFKFSDDSQLNSAFKIILWDILLPSVIKAFT
jgi:hypothetical protein